jgi:hypothetical protein
MTRGRNMECRIGIAVAGTRVRESDFRGRSLSEHPKDSPRAMGSRRASGVQIDPGQLPALGGLGSARCHGDMLPDQNEDNTRLLRSAGASPHRSDQSTA